MLEITNLTKSYKKFDAVKNLNLFIEEGEIGVLAGPNGAGKSTTIKSIAGLLRYKGEIKIGGYSNKSNRRKEIIFLCTRASWFVSFINSKRAYSFYGKGLWYKRL